MRQFFASYSHLERNILLAVLSFSVAGLLSMFAGAVALLHPVVSLILIVPAFFTVKSLQLFFQELKPSWSNFPIKIATALLFFTLFSHFIGVLLPETGFDALWYHLPLIKAYVEQDRLFYHPNFYQSLYPQLGDMLFALGFQIAGVFGTKLMVYWSGILLLLVCYVWLRKHTSQIWSLLMVTVIALFQVVGWQMSSVYVDVVSALWLVTGVWLILGRVAEWQSNKVAQKQEFKDTSVLFASFFLACFITTKFINYGSIPLVVGLLAWKIGVDSSQRWQLSEFISGWKTLIKAVAILTVISGFWIGRAYYYTGNLLYPMNDPYLESPVVQMQRGGWSEWFGYRLTNVYRLPWEFFFQNDGYTTLLIPVLIAVIIYLVKKSVKIERQWVVTWIIGGYGLLFWWFFPPPSTRYVLGQIIIGFIGLAVVVGQAMENWKMGEWDNWKNGKKLLYLLVFLSILAHLSVRLAINTRGIPYLLGIETMQQYLDRFRNGFSDEKINNWYGR